MKLAIIGFGNMGKIHYKAIKKHLNCEEPIIVDSNPSSIEKFDNLEIITDFQYFLESKTHDIDGVIISTPSNIHLNQAELLIKKEIPCLVEKPLTSSKQDDQFLLSLVDYDYQLKCGLIELYNPVVQELSEIKYNKIKFAHFKRHSPKTESHRKLENIVLDLSLHDISILYKIFKPKNIEILGVDLNKENDIAESAQVLLKINNEFSVFLSSSRQDQEKARTIDIIDSEANYHCDLKNKFYEVKQSGKVDAINSKSITESNLLKKVDMLDKPETAEIQLEKFISDITEKKQEKIHLDIIKKSHELAYKILSFN